MTKRILKAGAAETPVTANDRTDLTDLLATLGPAPTFAEIRAALPAGKRARATDGLIEQIARDLGLTVTRDE